MSKPSSGLNQGGKTLRAAVFLSLPGPLVTGIAATSSNSVTQLADLIRRTVELVATIHSLRVHHKLHGEKPLSPAEQARLERSVGRVTAWVMLCSGFALLAVGALRMNHHRASGNVTLGLIIAMLGLLTNGWFCLRYRRLAREQGDPVMAAQFRLYRAKTMVDCCVVLALATVAFAPDAAFTRYVDGIGSMVVAGYLFVQGIGMLRQKGAGV